MRDPSFPSSAAGRVLAESVEEALRMAFSTPRAERAVKLAEIRAGIPSKLIAAGLNVDDAHAIAKSWDLSIEVAEDVN